MSRDKITFEEIKDDDKNDVRDAYVNIVDNIILNLENLYRIMKEQTPLDSKSALSKAYLDGFEDCLNGISNIKEKFLENLYAKYDKEAK